MPEAGFRPPTILERERAVPPNGLHLVQRAVVQAMALVGGLAVACDAHDVADRDIEFVLFEHLEVLRV